MELDKMSPAVESSRGFAEEAAQESTATLEKMTPEKILAQKIRCQYEVMKLVGFLSFGFDPKDMRPEFDEEINAAMTLWCQDINGIKDTSNAAVFAREYEAITQDKEKFGVLKNTSPENQDARNSILQAIADKLISKQRLVN